MPSWSFDVATGRGTLEIRKGAQVASAKTINGNTVNLDGNGEMVSVVVPNPLGTINLAGLPFKGDDKDRSRDMFQHFNLKTGGA